MLSVGTRLNDDYFQLDGLGWYPDDVLDVFSCAKNGYRKFVVIFGDKILAEGGYLIMQNLAVFSETPSLYLWENS